MQENIRSLFLKAKPKVKGVKSSLHDMQHAWRIGRLIIYSWEEQGRLIQFISKHSPILFSQRCKKTLRILYGERLYGP